MLMEVSREFGTRARPANFRTGRFMHIPINSTALQKHREVLYIISVANGMLRSQGQMALQEKH